MTTDSRPHVVIVGGGFAGLWATRALARDAVRVTLLEAGVAHLRALSAVHQHYVLLQQRCPRLVLMVKALRCCAACREREQQHGGDE